MNTKKEEFVRFSLNPNYKIGNWGTVMGPEVKRKQRIDSQGYPSVSIRVKGKVKQFRVHRLVAHAHLNLDIMNSIVVIHHRDENKTNNHWTNLYGLSREENTHASRKNKSFPINIHMNYNRYVYRKRYKGNILQRSFETLEEAIKFKADMENFLGLK